MKHETSGPGLFLLLFFADYIEGIRRSAAHRESESELDDSEYNDDIRDHDGGHGHGSSHGVAVPVTGPSMNLGGLSRSMKVPLRL